MTIDEIKDLEKRIIGDDILDPLIEIEWIEREQNAVKKDMLNVVAAFGLYKFLNKEEFMLRCEVQIKEYRNSLKYFEARLKELQDAI